MKKQELSLEFYQNLEKAELHAHLFGSIKQAQLLKLLKQNGFMKEY